MSKKEQENPVQKPEKVEEEKDLIEESVKAMQDKINSIECWNFVSQSTTLLSQARKEKYTKLGVYNKIEEEVREFAKNKAKQIASGQATIGIDFGNKDETAYTLFTKQQAEILKGLANKVQGKMTIAPQAGKTETPLAPYQPTNAPTPYGKRRGQRRAERVSEDGFPVVGSRGHRTNIHDSLKLISNPNGNDPAPYSSVEIIEVNKEDKRATIEFTGKESVGTRATIDVCDLVGFEDI